MHGVRVHYLCDVIENWQELGLNDVKDHRDFSVLAFPGHWPEAWIIQAAGCVEFVIVKPNFSLLKPLKVHLTRKRSLYFSIIAKRP